MAESGFEGRSTGCRVCGSPFSARPLLRYENMPGAAQGFPDGDSLARDRGVDLEVWQCSGCGLVQLANAPVPYYKDVIRAAAVSPEMTAFRQAQFSAFVQRFGLGGRKVLEVGCGKGEFLSILQSSGAAAYGIEHAADSVAACRANGLDVTQGFLPGDAASLAEAPFDAFLILNFLEHLPDPNGSLREIGAVLNADGVGLVEVPNFDMILRRNLFSEFIGDHLFYFTRETLEFALRRNGFEVLECAEVWHDYILSAVVRKRRPAALSGFRERQAAIERETDAWLRRFGEGNVAVWGAGHQSLALMSLLKLADRVRYVVDSAPFKQGKFTPATHLPVVPPDTLLRDPVRAVLVMAASYSDEVAAILRRDFDPALAVAVMRDGGLEEV